MNHYPNSHHLYSWPNGPIKNIEKLGMITFLKIKIPLHLAWTQPGIYGDYFFASFSKVVFRKVLRIVLCKRRCLKWEFVKIFLFKVVMAQEEWCLGTQTTFLYFTQFDYSDRNVLRKHEVFHLCLWIPFFKLLDFTFLPNHKMLVRYKFFSV